MRAAGLLGFVVLTACGGESVIRSAPQLAERLPGAGTVRGRFKDAEVKALVAALRRKEGPLRRVR